MNVISRLIAVILLASALVGVAVPTAWAECYPFPESATDQLDVGYAFIATVTESSGDVDPPDGDYAPFNWHVELRIDRSYLGKLPKTIVYNGWDVGCHELRADQLKTGDIIFILLEQFHPEFTPRDPFDGDVVLWKRAAGRWQFEPDLLAYSADTKVYTREVRDASTTAAILRVLASVTLPQTDALAPTKPPLRADDFVPALVFIGGFVLMLGYLGRRAAKPKSRVIERR